ncbi:hypothetical protein BDA99DRAFT_549329 [Phascolomyces articulosus]|uniref:BHLH domain-containing protein n=1 Tax=Phascolomyces articulosus TaxID=60185 RepID=A0AAD5JMA5_9FUNG|nr:hypothetical protein BDA99DRAFT_549329 [Phascolomyces articulosus]
MPYPVQQHPPTTSTRFGYCPEQMSPPQHRSYHHPASPDSESASSSSKSPQTPSATTTTTASSTTTSNNNNTNTTTEVSNAQQLVTPLVPSSPPKFSNPTTDRVKETIARANSVPMEFYHTEFLEYSKETYEKKIGARNKRKRQQQQNEDATTTSVNKKQKREDTLGDEQVSSTTTLVSNGADDFVKDEEDTQDFLKNVDDETDPEQLTNAELRRQIHIQSEQKRRAQIKDGFDELRKHLPGCNNKKMSKAALLNRTVQQMQHLKTMQVELLEEVERLMQENENLKKFQHDVFQRQAMEKMYTF